MKKIMTVFGALLVGSMLITSCVSTNRGFQSSPVVSRNVELDPIKADIKVDEKSKITGESSSTYLFLLFRVGGDNVFADGINYSTDQSASKLSRLNPIKFRADRLNKVRAAAACVVCCCQRVDAMLQVTQGSADYAAALQSTRRF
jgi:hypothetical protein